MVNTTKKQQTKRLRIGSWNVRGLGIKGKQQLICEEMDLLKISILGMSETYLTQQEYKLRPTKRSKVTYTIITAGRDEKAKGGVGFLIDDKIEVLDTFTSNINVMGILIKSKIIVQVYGVQSSDTKLNMKIFYNNIDRCIKELRKGKEEVIIIGDFNAQVAYNKELNDIVGKSVMNRQTNKTGRMLIDYCRNTKIKLTSTFSNNKRKYTWKGPTGKQTTIDYIASACKIKCRIEHRMKGYSDHNIVIGVVNMNKTTFKRKFTQRKEVIDRTWIKEKKENLEKYQENLSKKGSTQGWSELANKLITVANDTIPKIKYQKRNNWITNNIIDLIKERKKVKNIEELHNISRKIRNECRIAKQKEIDKQCEEIEMLESKNRTRNMYQIVRKICPKPRTGKAKCILSKNGNKIIDKTKITKRWSEYMNDLYTNEGETIQTEENKASEIITDEEIESAIRYIKNHKATGNDLIPVELIKNANRESIEEFKIVIKEIYQGKDIPREWLSTIFVTLPKKQYTQKCDEHRMIALIPHGMKVLTKIMTNRISEGLIDQLDENQFGFRAGRGTLEGVACLKMIGANRINKGKNTYVCFIDFRKAFDRVGHVKLLEILEQRKVPKRELELLSEVYKNQVGYMKEDEKCEYPVRIGKGVRQGCALSPILYNTYADHVMKKLDQMPGIIIGGKVVNRLSYADDTVLIANTMQELDNLIKKVIEEGNKFNIEINKEKTKIMMIQQKGHTKIKSKFGYKQVENFAYLGVKIDENIQHQIDIRSSIGKAKAAFWTHKELMRHNLALSTKIKLLNSQVFSIMKYCAESFVLTKLLKGKITSFEMWCYRRILKISWMDLINNEKVLQRMKINKPVLLEMILKRKCIYLGHVARGSAGGTIKELCEDERKVGKGGRRRRWTDDLQELVRENEKLNKKQNSIRYKYITRNATDKAKWHEIIKARWP